MGPQQYARLQTSLSQPGINGSGTHHTHSNSHAHSQQTPPFQMYNGYQQSQSQQPLQQLTSQYSAIASMPASTTTSTTPAIYSSASNDLLQRQLSPDSIRNVWRWNLDEQMAVLRQVVHQYKYISLDCKFPGIVARPIGTFKTTSEYHYQTLRANADILKVVQIGMTFADEHGNRPPGVCTWQFNFKFSQHEDMSSKDGLQLLLQSQVNLAMMEVEGIDAFAFAELLVSSGLVLAPDVHWITYHSGYDLGYLMSLMMNDRLPTEESQFLRRVALYFPAVWDIKYIVRALNLSNKATLAGVADDLQIRPPGYQLLLDGTAVAAQPAANESLLTNAIFFQTRKMAPEIVDKCMGMLFGLGEGMAQASQVSLDVKAEAS